MSRSDDSSSAPTSASLTEYTLTIEATCTATVVVKSTSPIKAGKWLRDVAIPNQLVEHGRLNYDWKTAKVTWDDGDEVDRDPSWIHSPGYGAGYSAFVQGIETPGEGIDVDDWNAGYRAALAHHEGEGDPS